MKHNHVETLSMDNIGINWNLDESGKLTVTGNGKIADCSCGNKPAAQWNDVKDQILEIEISEGITEIGVNAFRDCKNLKSVMLPDSLFRIHAYAFWNCIQLEEIRSNRPDFKYFYHQREYEKDKTVIFGIGSFYNVPWSINKWDKFYCEEDALYICFSGEQDVVIPKGIRVLKMFSMAHMDVNSVRLPKTLNVIENLAFSNSTIKENLFLPDSLQTIEPNAFSSCSVPIISFPPSWRPEKTNWKGVESNMMRRKEKNKYSIALMRKKNMGAFRKIEIIENKPTYHKDGTVTEVREGNYIDIGKSLYRRIRSGKVILCITHGDDRIISVKSFAWKSSYELPEEYLMYPMIDQEGQLLPWRDSFTYQEEEDITDAFYNTNAAALKDAGVLRFIHPSTHEEWFWSNDRWNYGGPLEMELLKLWLKEHPGMKVDTADENRKNDKTRWFVDV